MPDLIDQLATLCKVDFASLAAWHEQPACSYLLSHWKMLLEKIWTIMSFLHTGLICNHNHAARHQEVQTAMPCNLQRSHKANVNWPFEALYGMQAPMLYCGEKIGTGKPPEVDVALDPLDGTTIIAQASLLLAVLTQMNLLQCWPCHAQVPEATCSSQLEGLICLICWP